MEKILIVEDDNEIASVLKSFLEGKGYEVLCAEDGRYASEIMKSQDFSLILMDMMLPFRSGDELIAEFRQYSQIPVIVVSAKSEMDTRLDVLRLGADDYILKPFDLNEVLVRIEVVLRRSRTVQESSRQLKFGQLVLDISENILLCDNTPLILTSKEMSLMRLFMEHPSKVFTKANLYESVWNEPYYYEDNTVNVHISNLRNKIKKASGMNYIETVWGIGYRMKEE